LWWTVVEAVINKKSRSRLWLQDYKYELGHNYNDDYETTTTHTQIHAHAKKMRNSQTSAAVGDKSDRRHGRRSKT
jgi:hypothetical protein